MANVIDIIVRVTDRATSTLQRVTRGIKNALGGITGIVGGVGLTLALGKVIQATDKQEKAVAKLDAVLRSTNNAIGFTTDELRGFAAELQKVTTYGDESIIELQALLATFTQLRGPIFKEATEVVLNMSTLLGRDFRESAIQVGKALQDPILGVTALRRSGVNLTKSQQDVIRKLVETGQVAKAQRIILDELQTEFGGIARAARDTLGGALDGLKNAFGDLFELSGTQTKGAQEAIEGLTSVLQDPKTLKAVNDLIVGITKLTSLFVKLGQLGSMGFTLGFAVPVLQGAERVRGRLGIAEQEEQRRRSSTAPSLASRRGESGRALARRLEAEDAERAAELQKVFDSIQPIEIRVKPLVLTDPITQQLQDLRRATLTPIEAEAEDLRAALNETDAIIALIEAQIRSGATELQKTLELAKQVKAQQIDSGLQEFDLTEIASRKLPTQVGERFREVSAFAERASQQIQDAFVGVFKSIGNGTDGMVESFVNAFKEIVLQAAALDLVRALGLDKIFSGGAAAGGGGFLGAIFGGLFGRASGGYASRPFIAGEEGKELVVPSGLVRVFNQRQLGFGASSGVNFAPTTNIAITARSDDANMLRREFLTALAENNKVQQRELVRVMERNGIGRVR